MLNQVKLEVTQTLYLTSSNNYNTSFQKYGITIFCFMYTQNWRY